MVSLPKQSFLALVAIGWVDGQLQRVEITGLTRAAKEAGLAADAMKDIEAATKAQMDLSALDFAGLSDWDKVVTYALGAWVAEVDGVVSTSESDMLAELGKKLGISDAIRTRAGIAAHDIACLPQGGKPEKYDFQKLIARLRERLPQVASK